MTTTETYRIEKYRPSMSLDVLHAWAADVQAALDAFDITLPHIPETCPDCGASDRTHREECWVDREVDGIREEVAGLLSLYVETITELNGLRRLQGDEALGIVWSTPRRYARGFGATMMQTVPGWLMPLIRHEAASRAAEITARLAVIESELVAASVEDES